MKQLYTLALAAGLLLAAGACQRQDVRPTATDQTAATGNALSENFEQGSKASYATGNVTFSSGVWSLNDALVGNSSSDVKSGSQAVRVRNSGILSMQFDKAGGAGVLSVSHANYGSDAGGSFTCWYSTNSGGSYAQAGGTVTCGGSLATASFTINATGSVRVQLRKADGGTGRINLDNVVITDYSGTVTPPDTTPVHTGHKKFLFDNTKAETAGNADWVIDEDGGNAQRLPTPAQSTVTASTSESYWTGALSSWGIALVKAGHTVETLPSSGQITFGNASNPQDLSNYSVYIVDEPNTRFTSAEKTAILNFVKAGGGLLMISDHSGSDRNNDGYDSPAVWTDLFTNNTVQTNPFGFSSITGSVSGVSGNVGAASSSKILSGLAGAVSQVEFNAGATFSVSTSANPSALGLVWKSGVTQGSSNVLAASATFGSGRAFLITDSSPMDDGTGASGNSLYASWSTYSHSKLFLNASYWLAKLQ